MVTFRTKRNDTKPIRMSLQHKDPQSGAISAADLTTATGVRFLMDSVTEQGDLGSAIVAAPANILDPLAGLVEYEFQPAETAAAGEYRAEFEVTYTGGEIETFPEKDYIRVLVQEDLG